MICRLFAFVLLATLTSTAALAGSLSTLTAYSARYFGSLNRHASIDADAGPYNLAGQAFGRQGLSIMTANQSWLRLERLSFRETPDSDRTNYDATNGVPSIPTLNINYNHGDWGLYFYGGVPAGGGADFKTGHPLYIEFEDLALDVARQLAADLDIPPEAITDVKAQDGGRVTAKAMIFGLTFGGYYKPTDWLSIGAAVRYVEGQYTYTASSTYDIINEDLGVLQEYPAVVNTVHNATGAGFMVGMHLQPTKELNIGLQFQSNTKLKYIFSTAQDSTGLYPDGGGVRKDIPPLLSMGVSYQLTDDLQVSSSWAIYFNKLSKQGMNAAGQKNTDNYRNGWEGGLGIEYRVIQPLTLRTGFLFNRAAHTQQALSSLTWSFDHFLVGTGLTWHCVDWVDFTMGFSQMLPNGGLNESESIEFYVSRTALALELDFYF